MNRNICIYQEFLTEAQAQAEKEEKARKKEDPAAADQETT